MLKNDRFIKALLKQPVDRTPIWIMRQAGRYLPEYRATRKQAGSFMDLCRNPELACEVTMQPLRRFDLDAAILFSDILTVPEAMGLDLEFTPGEGPKFNNPINSARDINQLGSPDPEDELGYVMNAVRTIKAELNGRVPLIGFTGSPWTLATYMVEGGSSKTFAKLKAMLYQEPKLLHQLLQQTSAVVSDYLNGQINAGVDAVMIFDTWGGALSYPAYQEFSLNYMHKISENLIRQKDNNKIPLIMFTKGGGNWLELMAKTNVDALGLDWTVNLQQARNRVGAQVALQGNLDPCALYGNEHSIRQEVKRILAEFGTGSGHVFNLGHGIHPDMNPDNVKILVDAVHELSEQYH